MTNVLFYILGIITGGPAVCLIMAAVMMKRCNECSERTGVYIKLANRYIRAFLNVNHAIEKGLENTKILQETVPDPDGCSYLDGRIDAYAEILKSMEEEIPTKDELQSETER